MIIFLLALLIIIAIGLVIYLLHYAEKVNPQSSKYHYQAPYTTQIAKNRDIILNKSHVLTFEEGIYIRFFVKALSAVRILRNAWFHTSPFTGNVSQIIKQIHEERFQVTKAYVISGEHFTDLYPRNYGIFCSASLDARFAFSQEDWINRQRCLLQTVALHLDLLSQTQMPYTTYMQYKKYHYTGVNVWVTPSDTLYSVLFTLHSLINDSFLRTIYPGKTKNIYQLQTIHAGKDLIAQYKISLTNVINNFLNYALDSQTHLVKKEILLSGVRDHIKRHSAFYDNVVIWATAKLAYELDIRVTTKEKLKQWKNNIILNFWDDEAGIFWDDLSSTSKKEKIFCADFLIVIASQFLDPKIEDDRKKLMRIVEYIKKNKLDDPFPIQYAKEDPLDRMFLISKILFPSYIGKSRFAHWGIEYIKLLYLLSSYDKKYLLEAEEYLKLYENQIEKYGGYPEIYDKEGNIFETEFYRSVLHTGWVVNFEQAKMLIENSSN